MPGSSPHGPGETRRQAILVGGMHRSGTSALTRILSLLGVELGARPMPADKDHRAGCWKHDDIVRIHDEMLKELGSSWDDLRPLREADLRSERTEIFRTRILEILQRDFSATPLWGVKDPRLCRLLPLWDGICRDFDSTPRFLIGVRHPNEVAASLRRRDGFASEKSHLLWLEHSLRMERLTRGRLRSFVAYEKLLADWRPELERVGRELGIEWSRSPDSVAAEVDEFLNPKLRHHMAAHGGAGREALGRWVRETYAAMIRATTGDLDGLGECLDAIAAEMATAGKLFYPVIAQQGRELADVASLVR